MAFLSALLAGQAGLATQKQQNYQDAVAKQAADTKAAQQQAQFDAEQHRLAAESAQQANEFDKNYTLAQAQNARAQAEADRIAKASRPPDPAHGDKYGGMQYQLDQLALKTGNANLAGIGARNAGQVLQNQGTALDLAWAPVLHSVDLLSKELANDAQTTANLYAPAEAQARIAGQAIANENNRGRTPAAEEAAANRRLVLQNALDKSLYQWQATVASASPGDVQKQYVASEKAVGDAAKALLEGKTIGPLGKPAPIASDAVRNGVAKATSGMQAAPDPFAYAQQQIAAMPTTPEFNAARPLVIQYFLAYAQSVVLQRKMTGQTPPAAVSAPAGAVTPGVAPGGFDLSKPNAGLGSMYGGSQGAGNPTLR